MLHHRDYGANDVLDRYSDAGIDDDEEVEELSAAARRAAEAKMERRDRTERGDKRGQRAARRSHAPAFLGSDNDMDDEDGDELGISTMKRRTRKQYDERRDADDLDGIEDVGLLQTPLLYCLFMYYLNRKSLWNNSVISRQSPLSSGLLMTVSADRLSGTSANS